MKRIVHLPHHRCSEQTLHAVLTAKLAEAMKLLDSDPPAQVATRTIARIADLRGQLRAME
jgi:hypothetical protein